MKLIPDILRRPGFPDKEVSRLRCCIEEFLKHSDSTESALIIDGMGPGVGSHFVTLMLLGPERVSRFRSIHSVCTGSAGVLLFLAWQKGLLSSAYERSGNLNRANQAGHNIAGWRRGSCLLLRMLFGFPYLFPNDCTEKILAYVARPEFLQMKVSEMPENVFFLTYCAEERSLCEIGRNSRFADWSMGDVIRCVTALKKIYAPFHKEGKTYLDAVTDRPQLREFFRNLRGRNRHVIFLHMNREGIHENTTYLKMHNTGSGKVRIMLDFLYFMYGLENRDVDEAGHVALHGITPIQET
jgi:hypothetical protein